ncbi:cell division protein SepF [Halalkalibacterium halodurans]|uniref:Cell division protein SepF n=1 Tax=Halalkalibacterium halodurans (strain ATCC BAA-125 / DSM 18197 / FERM 7344 / JCM 9153 / C-125) TaxID=272558 RepID=SEPF_HALH5|nr:cell division protein SepF [Halalkalibacterium halodurans]Q9K9U6.2 RecName: Full=Cell division protein SepF [Halalkalibacterium halodurans C-125]MDY7223087.1 cell division protein SepF [Halalkalibacterium halodurans]MDY7242308.1 cell division protein SepF [Halalkalibacterium halodurans]MED4125438.1 cell division protein SepF [Halalkalibacterium halodurans]MED4172013.1 cell division protein SepF [Halalkalibacterium halodurans]
MGMKSKFKRFFELDDDASMYEEDAVSRDFVEEVEEPRRRSRTGVKQERETGQNVVSLQSVQKTAKVVLLEPRTYDEAQEIADQLKNRKAVIINLQRISHEQAKRVVDFLSGTVYAIGGDIQKLGMNIFLCTPDNVDVTGTITDMIQDGYRS